MYETLMPHGLGGGRAPAVARRRYVAVDRACRTGAPRAFDATVKRLGNPLHASPDTSRRRLAELEASGLIEVTERSGGWLSVRVVLDAAEAAEVAEAPMEESISLPALYRASDAAMLASFH
jgi:hypothetical protein